MCELFGVSSAKPEKLNNELKEFFSHSPAHPNGWGLALLDEGDFSLEKEPIKALNSHYLKARLSEPIIAKTALAHIRLATIGNMDWKNCHPFTGMDDSGRRWTLIHNGTIFECDVMNRYVSIQRGETDSERILLYLIDCMNAGIQKKGQKLSAEERFKIVDDLVIEASPENKLNLLIYDEDLLYVHCNYQGSLNRMFTRDSVFFSTEPLKHGEWEPVPCTQLEAYRQGQLVYTGTNHGQNYIPDPKKMDMLFLAFSQL